MEYQSQTKNCQNCKKDFIIESDDFLFYEKIKVPPPTWCSFCRFIRRISFNNFSVFYKRKCSLCKNDMVSIYKEDTPFNVYCNKCWWNDSWDGREYGSDYNEKINFFEQLIKLRDKSNFMTLENLEPSLVDSPYTNQAGYQKNCFMTVMADYDENCAYCTIVAHSKDCLDCYRAVSSELCYECVGIFKSYRSYWSEELDNCVDCILCQACSGCQDCFGCVNLKNKKFCIFNIQYSKEEYKNKMKELDFFNHDKQKDLKDKAMSFWMKNPKKYYRGSSLNLNVTGDYAYESKNTKNGYMITGAEDCNFVQYLSVSSTKDCYDISSWGAGLELSYECSVIGDGSYNNKFCSECWPQVRNLEYCIYCINCKDCFGCINLKKKQYCILNKQYTKEEYFMLKDKIIKSIIENPYKDPSGHSYTYGEFLPPILSSFGYNETIAQEHNPLIKEDAINCGFNWYDTPKRNYNINLRDNNIPNYINNTDDDIKNKVIECFSCNRGFNISTLELELLRKTKNPIPHECSNCRHNRRFNRVNGFKFYKRNCNKCGIDIETSYSPDRPEIIYCERCYQQEVY